MPHPEVTLSPVEPDRHRCLSSALALLCSVAACSPLIPDPARVGDSRESRVLIYGHGYSLLFQEMEQPLRHDALPGFVDEVNRREPSAVFGLGDHTHGSTQSEWDLLGSHLSQIRSDLYLIRGNHDLKALPDTYFTLGGSRECNRVVDLELGGQVQRFVLLDARPRYSPEDLAFLKDAVRDPDSRAHTFVLMHYQSFFDRPLADLPADLDPNAPYTGFSNWNEDVVPILEDQVDLVITGDLYPRLIGRYDSPDGLSYVCTGFPFYGQGPLVYLELGFDAHGDLEHAMPRVVGLDVRAPYYKQAFPVAGPELSLERGMGHLRTVAVLTDDNRRRLLNEALANFVIAKSWSHVAETMEASRNLGVAPSIPLVHPVGTHAWTVAADSADATLSSRAPTRLIVLNPSNDKVTVRLRWNGEGDGDLRWHRIDNASTAKGHAALRDGHVDFSLEPRAEAAFQLQLTSGSADRTILGCE